MSTSTFRTLARQLGELLPNIALVYLLGKNVARENNCAGCLVRPFLNKLYRTRKQPCALKMNWPLLSACHASYLHESVSLSL